MTASTVSKGRPGVSRVRYVPPARVSVLGAVLALIMSLMSSAASEQFASKASAATVDVSQGSSDLTLVSKTQLTPRLVELTFHTSILSFDPKVRVSLPEEYEKTKGRYPALYLLHGGTDDHTSWNDAARGGAMEATAALPLIVVMPDGGDAGFYSDWYNFGDYGKPMWETFHNDLLVPWIDSNFRTIAKREARAVAGASMGGLGALANAARHPDLYGATASFSGAVDLNNPALENLTVVGGISDGKKQPGSIFGYKQTDEVRWRGNNPWDLAANLANTDVSLYTGNGLPGGPNGNTELDLEVIIHESNLSMHDRLLRLGIPHKWSDYGPGNHTWYYFNRSFEQWLPHLMSYFGQDNSTPQSFVFASLKETYKRFDWSVSMQRPALEFSALDVANPNRFSIAGSGTANVSTAPLYKAKAWYRVTTSGTMGSEQHILQADTAGRLTMTLTLGPGNPHQQYTPEAAAHDTLTCATRLDMGDITDPPFVVVGDGCSFYRTAVTVDRV